MGRFFRSCIACKTIGAKKERSTNFYASNNFTPVFLPIVSDLGTHLATPGNPVRK
jgi:hypothetical protein